MRQTPSTLAPLMRRTQKESRYWALPGLSTLSSKPSPAGILLPPLPCETPMPAPSACWASGFSSPNIPGGGSWTRPPCPGALRPGRPVADGCLFPGPAVKLLDSDQELYRNFPLTISERWQQEVAETVFDTINAETDRLEARKKTKNKQLGHEEGEGRRLLWAPSAHLKDRSLSYVVGREKIMSNYKQLK